MFTEVGVLGGNTHRTGIQVALAHHDTAQNDERGSTKAKLLGTQQGHENDITTSLDLSVNL